MKASYYVFGSFLFLLAGISIWRVTTYKHVVPEHAFLYDQSTSKINGCACLRSAARRLVEESQSRAPGEKVVLYSLGTAENGYQPKPEASFEIPVDRSLLGNRSKTAASIDEWVDSIVKKCEEIPRAGRTPLLQAVRITLEQLRTKCIATDSCSLFVQSDLRDDVSQEFSKALHMERAGKETQGLSKLDNTRIRITFSGIAEIVSPSKTKKNRKSEPIQNDEVLMLKNLWARSFTNPELIKFEPICDRPATQTAKQTTR